MHRILAGMYFSSCDQTVIIGLYKYFSFQENVQRTNNRLVLDCELLFLINKCNILFVHYIEWSETKRWRLNTLFSTGHCAEKPGQ